MALDAQLLEILACPEDKGPLLYFADEDALYNPRLKRRYTVRDDIPIMLVDEAETVDDAEHERLVALPAGDGVRPPFEAEAVDARDPRSSRSGRSERASVPTRVDGRVDRAKALR